MKYVGITLGVLLAAVLIFVVSGKSLSIDAELAKLTPADRLALDALLTETGLVATQLRALEMRQLKYSRKGVVVEQGRVVGLRLSNLPIKKTDAVAGLGALQELWLDDNGLTSVRGLGGLTMLQRLDLSHNQLRDVGELTGLQALQRLRLSHNAIQSVANLPALPALTELDLSNNQLTDVGPLVALPALTTLNVKDNPLKSLPTPIPEKWHVETDLEWPPAESRKAPPNYPPNWVAKTPRTNGKATDGSIDYKSHKVIVSIATVQGAIMNWKVPGDDHFGFETTLELEVKKGRVRAYLEYLPESDKFAKTTDGYIFVDAEPGKPGKIRGILTLTGGSQDTRLEWGFVLESLDGVAEGVVCRLYR